MNDGHGSDPKDWTLEDLVCPLCGFIHEPGDREACIPVPTDDLPADDPEYEAA